MLKIIKKFKQKNILKIKNSTNQGFVIIFAVTISAIILAVALGVTKVAYQEIKFGTEARETNNAFLAADTGVECALYSDKQPNSLFSVAGPAAYLPCASVTPTYVSTNKTGTYTFNVTGLGSSSNSCAKVTVIKSNFKAGVDISPFVTTSIVVKGYNIGDSNCDSTNPDRIERELNVNY